jgi:D-galactarolactone cycloisomerase
MPAGTPAAPVTPALGRIARVEAWALRAPIATPVVTSFGTMRDRPAVFVRLTGADGAQGWGEVWCNFPGVGAEHRARLLVDTVAPLVLAGDWPDITSLFEALEQRLAVLALQTGEPGPLAQARAGIDLAAWDLAARRAGQPLWRLLGGESGQARVYASGLHPNSSLALALSMHDLGHRAFKLKVGFDAHTDAQALIALRAALGAGATLMVDANQAWTPAQAVERITALAAARPLWVEEPLRADQPAAAWSALAATAPVPLAAGENLRGHAEFDALLHTRALAYLQPDVGKWGGLTGCRAVALRAPAHGAVFCPHWLGGPIGLLASMHLRAALGREGWVEWDANPNPIHERVQPLLPAVTDGTITLGEGPGLGAALAIQTWADLISWHGFAA